MATRKKIMKNWKKQKKELEEAIAIVGVVAAYKLIPKDMPVSEFPQRLIDYHEEQFDEEARNDVPSPADEARRARIDELKRGGVRPKRRKYEV